MLLKLLLFIIPVLQECASGEKFRFDNYTLYKVLPKSDQHLKLVQDLQYDKRYDFWTEPVASVDFVNIMTAPEDKFNFENYLTGNGVDFEIAIANIQQLIDKETIKMYTRNNLKSMQWDAYYTFEEIYAWLDDLTAAYSDIVTMINIGKSYEGRDIKGIKISHGPGRKSIFIEGGIHSREWISHATVNFITNELLTSDDEEIKAAARDFDWYIFPVLNPDGYVWTHVGYRLWRKNRQPYGSEIGVDLNRNWNNNWLVVGASADPATNTYAGPGPFSEPETRALSTFLRSIGDDMDMYLSFHSSGQILLIPFGNTTEPLANYYDAMNIGRRAMGALSVRFGTQYTSGNIAEAIYFASGSAPDWVKEDLNVPLVYCYELRDRGTYGHLLPADQILPNSLETMDSVLEIIHQGRRFGYFNSSNSLQISMALVMGIIMKLFL